MTELQFYIIKDTYKASKWIAMITLALMIISTASFYSMFFFYIFFALFALSCMNLFFIRIWLKNDTDDEYHRMFVEYTAKLEADKQAEKQAEQSMTYEDLPEYTGRSKFSVYKRIVNGIFILAYVPIAFVAMIQIDYYYFYETEDSMKTIGIALLGALFLVFICGLIIMNKKVYINHSGVRIVDRAKNVDKLFSWKDIQIIGIGKNGSDKFAGNKYIYISTSKLKYRPIISRYYEDKSTIVLRYDDAAIHCILRYWDKKIQDLGSLKSWQRYVEKIKD